MSSYSIIAYPGERSVGSPSGISHASASYSSVLVLVLSFTSPYDDGVVVRVHSARPPKKAKERSVVCAEVPASQVTAAGLIHAAGRMHEGHDFTSFFNKKSKIDAAVPGV